jgi:hypothetical protein
VKHLIPFVWVLTYGFGWYCPPPGGAPRYEPAVTTKVFHGTSQEGLIAASKFIKDAYITNYTLIHTETWFRHGTVSYQQESEWLSVKPPAVP